MENKHTVPHNIMDVEFKLFGSLTIRQFSWLAGTFVTSLMLYFSGIPAIVSYFLIAIAMMLGLGLAFLRVNEQPFSVWFGNYLKSLFGSQRKVYRKQGHTPKVLAEDYKSNTQKQANKQGIIKKDLASFQQVGAGSIRPASTDENEEVPDLLDSKRAQALDSYFSRLVSDNLGQYGLAAKEEEPAQQKAAKQESAPVDPAQSVQVQQAPAEQERTQQEPAQQAPAQQQPAQQEPTQQEQPAQAVDQSGKAAQAQATPQQQPTQKPSQQHSGEEESAPVPKLQIHKKLRPNQIAGFVVDAQDQPQKKAQIFIKSDSGELLRSTYSDVNGKFIFPSPLESGNYKIEVTAENLIFPEFFLQLSGELVPMYKYPAKEGVNN
ncbi:MAG: PrgI family mobile element protein [Candidatus Dojkabacteria bacterium]